MRLPVRCFPSLVWAASLSLPTLAMTAAGPETTASASAVPPAAARPRTDALLARADLAAYRGWIKFLRYEAEIAAGRSGPASEEAIAKMRRLDEWVARIAADPNLLATLTGVQEWAYESPADGSGQPFKMAIPIDYDPARPAPLSVYLHGYSGNHLEHATEMTAHPGAFELSVLGRSRGGGYWALSEADVLSVIDYVQAHWSIDPDRIRLNGGSMGGGGIYGLGARYPHRWASGRINCGFASHIPLGNLLTLPIYAAHSDDDWVVSVLHARGPLARLRELGGTAILDETTGYGHAVWTYAEGTARAVAWEQSQVRPDSRTVRRIDYTALDGGAVRGWWAEIAEWGPAPRPARFVLTVGHPNTLFAELTNITRLRLRLTESPFDRAQPLQVVVNGAIPITLPAPLPETIVLAPGAKGWHFEARAETTPWRLHTPGSALLLYEGEPLLIVYGTRGSDAERVAMRTAAVAASKSPNPAWLDSAGQQSGEAGSDGVPHSQNLYGRLNTRADTEVTDADLARCHLVLIGTARQNALVARLADRLPVRFADGAIRCDDGVNFPAAQRALGLVYYNPLAPDRLIFWVASDDPATYAAGAAIPALMGCKHRSIAGTVCGADLLVMHATARTLVAARSFDSRWHWTPGRENSPLVPASLKSHHDYSTAIGAAICRAADADFAFVGAYAPFDQAPVTAGITRISDVTLLCYYSPIGMAEMSGAEIIEATRRIAAAGDSPLLVCPSPRIKTGKIEAARNYRVAFPADALWQFSAVAKMAPRDSRQTDLDVGDAVERFLAMPE
ncbi:MAG: hypothetical protein PHE83_10385 [Opitutaceae bacterium]|nr:hypothetical protein [Opitutaceae bacterium]